MTFLFNRASGNRILIALCILCAASNLCFAQKDSTLEVTFISNQGFLIQSDGHGVLIDGLYKKSHPDFVFPSEEVLDQMTNGKAPFENVDVYLQSHIHYTHFFPETVGEFLLKRKEARMIALPQVLDSLVKFYGDYGKVEKQLMPYDWSKSKMDFSFEGVDIKAFKIKHDGQRQWGWVQNLGHLITIGNHKVLHMGDLMLEEQVLNDHNLASENIDLVILPYWVVLRPGGVKKIKRLINADNYIISHYRIPSTTQTIAQVKRIFPEAIILNTPMQKMVFKFKE